MKPNGITPHLPSGAVAIQKPMHPHESVEGSAINLVSAILADNEQSDANAGMEQIEQEVITVDVVDVTVVGE